MTNLDIIKYLALNKPERLADLLEDVYCCAFNDGAYDRVGDDSSIPSFQKWLYEDAFECGFYHDEELRMWAEPIKHPSVEVTYPGGLTVAFPYKDPTYAWNTNNEYEIINQAIDEIHLLENIIETEKYTDDVYNSFRNEVCADCDNMCLQSQMDIVQCPKCQFDTLNDTLENIKETNQ